MHACDHANRVNKWHSRKTRVLIVNVERMPRSSAPRPCRRWVSGGGGGGGGKAPTEGRRNSAREQRLTIGKSAENGNRKREVVEKIKKNVKIPFRNIKQNPIIRRMSLKSRLHYSVYFLEGSGVSGEGAALSYSPFRWINLEMESFSPEIAYACGYSAVGFKAGSPVTPRRSPQRLVYLHSGGSGGLRPPYSGGWGPRQPPRTLMPPLTPGKHRSPTELPLPGCVSTFPMKIGSRSLTRT